MERTTVLNLAALLLCFTSLPLYGKGYPTGGGGHSNIFLDIALCAMSWKAQTPPDLRTGLDSLPKPTDMPHYGLQQYLFLMEPYLTYLLVVNNQGDIIVAPGYKEIFENYCNEEVGIDLFISCVKQSTSYQSDLNLVSGKTAHSTDILENMKIRYCNSSGGVNEQVLAALRQDSSSEEIRKLARYVDPQHTNGTFPCSEVIETLIPTLTQLFTEGNVRIKAFFSLIERAIETFTRCLMVSVLPNEKALILKKHLEMVLLKLIDSNIADVTRIEMSLTKQTVSMAGYGNVLHRGRGHQTCSNMGTRMLLHNSHMKVEGVLLFDSKNNNLPYLAAVHIEFPLYDEKTLRHVGEITYSSGMDEPLETELVKWWRSERADQMAHVSTYEHGITIEDSLESAGSVEIIDLRTGTYITLNRDGRLLTMVIRMFTTFLYQSTGILLESCSNHNGHTPAYHVLRTSKECRQACHVPFTGDIRSMCQKDCLMSGNASQLGTVYKRLKAMRGMAEMKDELIEQMSAIENEPEVPGDAAVTDPSPQTVQYEHGLGDSIIEKDSISVLVTTSTPKPSPKPKMPVKTTPKKSGTKRNGVPAELANNQGSGAKATKFGSVLMCGFASFMCLLFIGY